MNDTQKATIIIPRIPLTESERETVRLRWLKLWNGPPETVLTVRFMGEPYCEKKNA